MDLIKILQNEKIKDKVKMLSKEMRGIFLEKMIEESLQSSREMASQLSECRADINDEFEQFKMDIAALRAESRAHAESRNGSRNRRSRMSRASRASRAPSEMMIVDEEQHDEERRRRMERRRQIESGDVSPSSMDSLSPHPGGMVGMGGMRGMGGMGGMGRRAVSPNGIRSVSPARPVTDEEQQKHMHEARAMLTDLEQTETHMENERERQKENLENKRRRLQDDRMMRAMQLLDDCLAMDGMYASEKQRQTENVKARLDELRRGREQRSKTPDTRGSDQSADRHPLNTPDPQDLEKY
ncbi:uncharacterized protein LOC124255102 [Haliotis rubra]|uniref:uncharacterized protein LOC124255102 n=1 Tax=Haliotis rubra TaxID=36100 RepID=UPI001EE50309|nr:uncharacterized protein LOC124255102 [Haliotis rubra]